MFDERIMNVRILVRIALLTALIVASSWVSIPFGPVPITLHTFFIMLAGMLLGPRYGLYTVLLFIGAGCIGLPVFAGGKAGVGVLMGPTGGYIVGYLALVTLSGFCKTRLWSSAFLLTLGTGIVYTCGTLWLAHSLNMSVSAALGVGMLPFLPGDTLKIAAILAIMYIRQQKHISLPLRNEEQ